MSTVCVLPFTRRVTRAIGVSGGPRPRPSADVCGSLAPLGSRIKSAEFGDAAPTTHGRLSGIEGQAVKLELVAGSSYSGSMSLFRTVFVTIAVVLAGAASARADVLLTPYAGFSRIYEENKGTF